MRRRRFLATIGVGSIGTIAGCISNEPEMNFQNFVVPDPVVVSVDNFENTYYGTIENRRGDGNVKAELWYFNDPNVPDPDVPASFYTDISQSKEFDIARTSYFSQNERREVTITTNNQPTQWSSWEFGILPWPASHGAVFTNEGQTGEIEVRFEFRDTLGYDVVEPPAKIESVGADESIEVSFNVVVPPRVEYEIVAEPR